MQGDFSILSSIVKLPLWNLSSQHCNSCIIIICTRVIFILCCNIALLCKRVCLTFLYALTIHLGKQDCSIVAVGPTGIGKSTLCRVLAKHLGLSPEDDTTFKSSSGPITYTELPEIWVSSQNITLVDTPGWMDTRGVEKNNENTAKIVERVSALGHVNGFLLVLNEQDPRFHGGIQDLVVLLVDSFGDSILSNMGVVFNKAFETISSAEFRNNTDIIASIISNITRIHVDRFESWQIDCMPEKQLRLTDDDRRNETENRDKTLGKIIKWACSKHPVDVTGAKIGE